MSVLDHIFSIFRKQKDYTDVGNVLKNKITTKDQREEAFSQLENLDPHVAIPQLLKRFTMVLESGLQDTQEKDRCVNYIVKYPDAARPLIVDFIKTYHQISWACRVAEKILEEDEYLDLLLSCLDADSLLFDDDALDKNRELLIVLKDSKSEKISNAVSPFLNHRDETLVIAALECLEEQGKSDENARKLIIDTAQKEMSDDNSRVVGLSKYISEKNGWKS